jgi:hypothetical protein
LSALGQKQTPALQKGMSALPPKADMCGATSNVGYGPIADIGLIFDHLMARLSTNALQKAFLLTEKRPHCRFNALAFGALVGVQFVARGFGFNPKKPHPRLAHWTIESDSGKCGGLLINDHSNSLESA